MSDTVVINSLYSAVILAFAALFIWFSCRRRPSEAERTAAARARAGLVPPAPDNEAGINLADADECALIYSLPVYDPAWDAGCERLWDAIRDEQNNQNGDHS